MKKLPKLLVIVGPTASGKTDLAEELARRHKGEIVTADSRTIYRGMDIGTAKPEGKVVRGKLTHNKVVHHLIDVVTPGEAFSLAEYKKKALSSIRSIIKRGKLPILCGGTGLYVWALVDNLQIPQVPPNHKLRVELEKKSTTELHRLLKATDPAAAEAIGLHNKRRMVRALEVLTVSGTKFSEQTKKGTPLFDTRLIGINLPRPDLYSRIDARVDAMLEAGFMAEVLNLRRELYSADLQAMSGIGYRELNEVIDGKTTLEKARERIKARTRDYARRQITWFKRDHRITWVSKPKDAFASVRAWLK